MGRLLKKKELRKLIKRHRKERDGRIRDRIKAVIAYDDGCAYSEIAKTLLVDSETIRRYIAAYRDNKKLITESGGSESKLDDNQTKELIAHLHEVTYLYVKDICRYVLENYEVKYSISGMTKWLNANGLRYKKAHGVPAKANKEKQQSFIKYYEQLKQVAGSKEPIYFADSVHPAHQTQLTYGWIPKDIRKEVATTGRQKRLNFIGGICLSGQRFTYQQADQVNAETICDFLWKLRKANPGKYYVHLIWDNASPHKNDEVHEFAEELGIKLHYLPPYSPNLNPIERLWKIFHEHVRYNKYYSTFSEFSEATLFFFKGIGRKKKLLSSRITDNFQLLHSDIPTV